jgi:DNA polymerase-3 subunit epsilon
MVSQANTDAAPSDGYPSLVERALECIQEHRGAVAEDALIQHVFGQASNAALWRPLLRSVLSGHPQVSLRADGVWKLGTPAPGGEFPSEFVVLDVETTGLKPSQQRIIEIGMIRVSEHGAPLRWTSLVNPGRKLPTYVAELTGIDDVALVHAPDFRSIAATVLEILDDVPIVSHNVGFDIAFLNAELTRCGLPSVVNPVVDTLALANRYAVEVRRLNLADVARALGIAAPKAHRALADAETTLEVFRQLLSRARDHGVTSLDDILRVNAASRPSRPVRKPVGRGRAVLDKSHLADIPQASGVYIMRDADERVLYVGKAKNLRKRVASYYSQPLGYTRKMDGLLETLSAIEVHVVGSELEALILESQLIRRYRPRFNTVQRNAEQYVYVKLDVSNPWPRVIVSRDRSPDGALYFGPFRSASRAREVVEVVNDLLPLRTCRRSFADKRSYGSPCLELSLKRCMGPCMGIADSDKYRGLVRDVIAFFRGDTTRLIGHAHSRLEETVRTLDFERAARLRDQIKRVEALAREQQRIDGASRYRHALLVLPSARPQEREVWYLLKGRRWAQLTVDESATPESIAARLEPIVARACAGEALLVTDHHAVDELSILARWMRRTPDHPALLSLDDAPCLVEIGQRILMVDLSVPFGEGGTSSDTDDDIQHRSVDEERSGAAGARPGPE